jgi:hypothetical protein
MKTSYPQQNTGMPVNQECIKREWKRQCVQETTTLPKSEKQLALIAFNITSKILFIRDDIAVAFASGLF